MMQFPLTLHMALTQVRDCCVAVEEKWPCTTYRCCNAQSNHCCASTVFHHFVFRLLHWLAEEFVSLPTSSRPLLPGVGDQQVAEGRFKGPCDTLQCQAFKLVKCMLWWIRSRNSVAHQGLPSCPTVAVEAANTVSSGKSPRHPNLEFFINRFAEGPWGCTRVHSQA